ncbi:pirin family protein [Roseateles amylovorans]|uniref:Pirin family protein n=1 Tax=Roseateles amylovorans TaxID=2978473 RepID=A0ABY6AZW8_9BURK|nr:pirin family protein [Roseateles amylovorans]UXH77848.1 pirin family protein [Roseateles amylovorans]
MTAALHATTIATPRQVERLIQGVATSDGAGVKLTRVLTRDLQRRLDPFLMLDAFGSDSADDYIAGFPDHPHRGFETVTYMLEGRMRHRDSAGNEGLLGTGGVQWMTAGRGLVHSELPEQQEGRMEGFQLWLNLPGRDKMRDPWYRDIPSGEIPEVELPGARVRVIAGESHGVVGAMQREATQPLYLDVHLEPGTRFEQAIPAAHNAFLYVYRGGLRFDTGCLVPSGRMALLANTPGSDGVRFTAAEEGTQAILVAGRPLNEPIAQYGPFVMNTEGELLQAVRDFQAGKFA